MPKQPHICFICHEYPPSNHGGIGSFTKDLAESLYENGYKVTVIGIYLKSVLPLNKKIDEIINGVRVIRYPFKKTFSYMPINTLLNRVELYKILKNLHKEAKINIIESPGGSGWLPYGTPNKIPLITRLHGGEVYTAFHSNKKQPSLITLLEKRQFLSSNKVVAVSHYTAKIISNLLNVNNNSIVIHNSVDNKLFNINCLNEKEGLILFFGTIKKAKGVEELLISMNHVFAKNKYAHLILAGKIPLGQDGNSYETYLRNLLPDKYQTKVTFTDILDRERELIPLICKANVCCFPSYFESFSLVPLEAMSLGKAVVFTELTSGPEVIQHTHNGLLCNPKSPDNIAENILSVLENTELKLKLETNAKKDVIEQFSFNNWIEKNIQLYKKVYNEEK